MEVYVASSWRNARQPSVVEALKAAGHEVYDFRNPAPGESGFSWHEIDPNWQAWTPGEYQLALQHPIAQRGFDRDMDALKACDACVLVMPCGRSAHLELGWAAGAGRRTIILLDGQSEPELMYAMTTRICESLDQVVEELARPAPHKCKDFSPPGYRGRWVDWHRGHGCHLDDGKPRCAAAQTEIDQLGGARG